jgi:transcriptional regulator with GAF, ATPase, and Fis domain
MLKIDERYAGQSGVCNKCGGKVVVSARTSAIAVPVGKGEKSAPGISPQAARRALWAQVGEIIKKACSVEELIDEVMSALLSLRECGPHGKAVAFLSDDAAQVLRLVKTRGQFSEEFLKEEQSVPFGECLCGRAAVEGEVLLCRNCFEDPRHEHHWLGMQIHGHYTIPLKSGARILGVITLYTGEDVHADNEQIAFLKNVGVMVGQCLDRFRSLGAPQG